MTGWWKPWKDKGLCPGQSNPSCLIWNAERFVYCFHCRKAQSARANKWHHAHKRRAASNNKRWYSANRDQRNARLRNERRAA